MASQRRDIRPTHLIQIYKKNAKIMKKYFPILVSKKGEIVALQHLEQNVKDEISPVIEVIDASIIKKNKNGGFEYKNDLEKFFKTHWSFFGNQVIMDFSLFQRWDLHSEKIRELLIYLINSGVNIVPSIQKNSSKIYSEIVKELVDDYSCNVCVRTSILLDGFYQFNNDIKELGVGFKIRPKNIVLLLDLTEVTIDNYKSSTDRAISTIESLNYPISEWSDVIVASSSFPENLTDFLVSPPERRIKRYEWESWKIIASLDSLKEVKYGDYGTKSAIYTEVGFAGTISLKYSCKEEYIIYRGELTVNHRLGHKQFIKHSQYLVKNESYSSKEFSWGDLRYYEISLQDYEDDTAKSGNTTNWVQFSQNHHLTLMHSIL